MKTLNKIYYLNKDIEKIENQIKELTALKALVFKFTPASKNNSSSVEDLVEKIESLEFELQKKISKRIEEQTRIESFIDKIDDDETRTIARMRYIENMTFQKIADELNYDRTTVSKKLDKYTKNIE